ncbi:MAG TPA: hypothetical protein VFG14_01565 [Chthoniobacteraceae bacterium]|nr:hypothetical protein [Chthoniobacteraceae bacterium]
MEAQKTYSEPVLGPWGRYEHYRVGMKSAVTPQIEAAFRAVHMIVLRSASITATHAVRGAESRLYRIGWVS